VKIEKVFQIAYWWFEICCGLPRPRQVWSWIRP